MTNVFIDESGIHKKIDHSSFVLVYIKVANLEKIEQAILKIENDLRINHFHWANTARKIKDQFISRALDLNFEIKIAIVRNPVRPDKELERILSHTIVENDINLVVIDGKKPKWYERKIKLILRNKRISVRKLKTVKDEQSPCTRLADMCAGLVRSHYDKKGAGEFTKYYRKLAKKIIITLE